LNDPMDKLPALQLKVPLLGMRSNAGPLDNVAIVFGPGVTAFYGQNGAGKTWILNSLRNALRGYSTGMTQLMCEFEPGSAGYEWTLDQVAETARDTRYKATPDHDREWLREAIETWFLNGGRYLKPYNFGEDLPPGLVDELSTVTTFALIPTGNLAPEWDIWLCMPRDSVGFPACARAIEEFMRVREETDAEANRRRDEYRRKVTALKSVAWTKKDYREIAKESERYDEEIEELLLSPLFQPLASLLWEYSYLPDPDAIDEWIDPMIADDLPIPVVKLLASRDIPLVLEADEDEADTDAATAEVFAEVFQKELEDADDGLTLTTKMKEWVGHLNEAANTLYTSLLQDAPNLTLQVRKLGRWAVEGAMHWHVKYGDNGSSTVPIAGLSRAESRWARIAIRRALDLASATTTLIIDEPEAALHRVAERHMAQGLDGLTTLGPQVVVATHSPEVLNAQTTGCIHVSKHNGRTHVGQMPSLGPETLAELGLSPSDLLGLYRIFLLVEGEHDEIVIRALCGDSIDTARVKIIPLRGGRNLPGTIESQLLFDLSDAHLVAVLDSVRAEEISSVWFEAQTRYLSEDAESAIDYLTKAFNQKKVMEHDWIVNWLSRAMKKGVHARINPYGLAARDIIEYLPVEVIVPRAGKSWDELRREHDAAMPTLNRTKGLHVFKTWLNHVYKADTTVTNVRRAAESVTEVPQEFCNLGYHLREISSRPRGQ
jgi:predicted ATPase